ncbi:MAG: dienelactone hydrolase family protein [Alphaproteobacteria bacterium]|nr:dienelactone hydrolase family protein [Alphaproteobacteria bacterium]
MLLCGCQTNPSARAPLTRPDPSTPIAKNSEIKKTWVFSESMVPIPLTRGPFARWIQIWTIKNEPWDAWVEREVLKPGIKVPVVIYAHGCYGLKGSHSQSYFAYFMHLGFLVIAPNSFARTGREEMCHRGGSHKQQMRLEEIEYAFDQIKSVSWIDQDKIILAGHSEGGAAAANWWRDGVAAVIISGYHCRVTGGSPMAPNNVPVLNIVGEFDSNTGDDSCDVSSRGRGSKVAEISGAGHSLAKYPETRNEIREFLTICCGFKFEEV